MRLNQKDTKNLFKKGGMLKSAFVTSLPTTK